MASTTSPPSLPKLQPGRLQFLKTVAPPPLIPIIEKLQKSDESNPDSHSAIINSAPVELVNHITLTNSVAELSNSHPAITKTLAADPDILSVYDIARKYDNKKLADVVLAGEASKASPLPTEKDSTAPSDPEGATPTAPEIPPAAVAFQQMLFHHEPSAVVARMVQGNEIPVHAPKAITGSSAVTGTPDANAVKDGVVRFFDNNPSFNIRLQSVATALSDPDSLNGVPAEHHEEVVKNLHTLQRTQALTPAPEAIPGLTRAGMTSAFKVAQIPENNFVVNHADDVGGEHLARNIHQHAVDVVIRNDHALTTALQTIRGTGVHMIDGHETRAQRIAKAQTLMANLPPNINLETLFGNMDYCDCGDCTSVTSPAAYFVELLSFLRNNNMKPALGTTTAQTFPSGYSGTPLEALFRRRPDIGNLELTCANTNTVLPYIDLANEVMESFICHLQEYAQSADPKSTNIDVWNVESNTEGLGGTTPELLAQPQNTNYYAYNVLKEAVYPSTKLPFNQPVETIRQFLAFLGTSRAELGERFRGPYLPIKVTVQDGINKPPTNGPEQQVALISYSSSSSSCSSDEDDEDEAEYTSNGGQTNPENDYTPLHSVTGPSTFQSAPISVQDQARLIALHNQALDRSDDAELLMLTEEEYIILTKEAFWAKEHFDIRHGANTPVEVYQARIGVKPDYKYWGVDYVSTNDMLSQDEITPQKQTGLTFVKTQFLPRTGIVYSELVDLLKTEFINPFMLKGRDKVVMESLRLSYKFLQSKITPNVKRYRDKYRPIVDYLMGPEWQQILKQFNITDDITTLFEKEIQAAGKCKVRHHRYCDCRLREVILDWLCQNFEKMGKIIVLESVLDAPNLTIEGYVVLPAQVPKIRLVQPNSVLAATGDPSLGPIGPPDPISGTIVGYLHTSGRIVAVSESDRRVWDDTKLLATVDLDGTVTLATPVAGKRDWSDEYPSSVTSIQDKNGVILATIQKPGASSKLITDKASVTSSQNVAPWVGIQDDCDISRVRLRQLDGGPVGLKEFDRMHRFLRLWRKLGWSMVEVDAALRVLGTPPAPQPVPTIYAPTPVAAPTTQPPDTDIDWTDFGLNCVSGNCQQQSCKKCQQDPPPAVPPTSGYDQSRKGKYRHRRKEITAVTLPEITAAFLHELVALKQLVDLTGLTLLQLLSFWGHIDTYGFPSLYATLFLTHNMLGIDRVFAADENGNYLVQTTPEKVSNHLQVIMAALQLKPADFTDFATEKKLLDADLTLENISTFYRYALLAKVLGLKPAKLDHAFDALGIKPYASAQQALVFIKLWNKISDAGFSFQQLDYVLTTTDDNLHPVGPSPRGLLQATMSIYTGLNDIDAKNQSITDVSQATSGAVISNVQLLFNSDITTQIVAFLEGKYVFTTNAPSGLVITTPTNPILKGKIKYADGDIAKLQVTGQLTNDETVQAKALSGNALWATAIDRIARQASTFLKTTLGSIFRFPFDDQTKAALITGDIAPPTDPALPNNDTAPKKRLFFLQAFIPFLKSKLAEKLISDTMATAVSLDSQITLDLLTYVLHEKDDPTVRALDALKKIKDDRSTASGSWNGYLIPPTTDTYTLVAVSDSESQPSDLIIEGAAVSFAVHSPDDDPSDLWASKPIRLTGGKLYQIQLPFQPNKLEWRTDRTEIASVPSSSLLANHVTENLAELFALLFKCAIVINGFSLTGTEVLYFQNRQDDFDSFDWNSFTLKHWSRVADYIKLKKSLPKLEKSLIDFFTWACNPTGGDKLVDWIYNVTTWQKADVTSLISSTNFNLDDPINFRNEVNFIKLQKALDTSNRIGVGVDLLFTWARPRVDFWTNHAIAESIRNSIRSRYKLSDWEAAIKPTYDKLRQSQSDALVAFLTVQPSLVAENIVDADSLFEFFLIDVSMCPCMETSRMKQATSSVQLFIQRCMLGLEKKVPLAALDRGRWDWMQKYRVWEANRKVYLYPENWIQPSLRDDKSPIYQQLESELMQKDLSTDAVMEIMKNYLFKLDDVANLEVDALHVEEGPETVDPTTKQPSYPAIKIHVFARTRHSPYKFYYRYYDIGAQNWQPWTDMQVDIPHYEVEKPTKDGADPIQGRPNGFYLVPFTYNRRLLVGLPQFLKVQLAQAPPDKPFQQIATEDNATASAAEEYWELKMGLTELRKGKWTAKVITADAISQDPRPKSLPPIGSFQFITRNIREESKVVIDVYNIDTSGMDVKTASATAVGRFTFTGSQFGKDPDDPVSTPPPSGLMSWTDFQFQRDLFGQDFMLGRVMFPLQGVTPTQALVYSGGDPEVRYPISEVDRTSTIVYYKKKPQNFYHSFVDDLLAVAGRTDNLDDLFGYFPQNIVNREAKYDAYGGEDNPSDPSHPSYDELHRPYSLYNWELGFHGPMALVDRLLQNQQFDLALKMCQYVFNPFADGIDDKRFWRWKPFQEVDSMNSLSKLFADLRPNTSDTPSGQINQWRDHPFQPHVLARLRPVAYMKFTVMKYIEILIAYGDYYFRQNTLETIPMAIQCYVLASHIYGARGMKIPKRGTTKVQTYNSLVDQWDAFDNAMVQLELAFPFSNQITTPKGAVNGVTGLANIWGFATTRYFCIPDNPQLRAVRDTIDDRLFKIRHCQDVNGVFRILPLYEPPIDPGLLVAAAAAGLSLSSVLNDLNSPLPNFRFTHLLHKAVEMCKQLRKLGQAFLAAKEKNDAEALLSLQAQHKTVIHSMVMDQKKLCLDEAQKAHDGLQQSRKIPEYRMTHTLKTLGEDLGQIPTISDAEQEFTEIVDQIEAPVVDSGMKLLASEKEEIEKAISSLDLKPIINAIELVASELHVLPVLNGHASPFGVGVAACWGPPNIAKGIQGAAAAYKMVSDWLAHQSANVSRTTAFVKQNRQRVKDANTAGHEVKAIDKQILTQQVKIAVHQQDITNQQKEIDNAQEIQDFLTNKYTKTELYTWLEQNVSGLYYNTYTATYQLAKKAEVAFRFERGLPSSNFIQFGYWETANSGLLAGERLYLSLKEMEAAYQENRGYDFELSKFASLRRINPLGLLKLRDDGTCDFALPEVLFDMDFPGHYQRILRSVAVTVQCSADPFTNINCTLRLLSHKFRTVGIAHGKGDYPEKTDQEDVRFATNHIPISSIAVSTADKDAGVFELDFKGERFMPFEGAGAISQWRLELNSSFRQFDYATITDVIIHLQYTSLDGGDALGQFASASVQDYIKNVVDVSDTEGLYAVFDVPRDFPVEWTTFTSGPTLRVLNLANLNEHLPVYTRGRPADRIVTKDVWIITEAAIAPSAVSVTQGNNVMSFSKGGNEAGTAMNELHSTDSVGMGTWAVSIGDVLPTMKQFWLVARYSLK